MMRFSPVSGTTVTTNVACFGGSNGSIDLTPIGAGPNRPFPGRDGPLFILRVHHSAPQASVAAAIRLGATAVIMERFDPAQFLQLVEAHRITHSQMVPTMFSRLLKLPDEVREHADVSSLEAIVRLARVLR